MDIQFTAYLIVAPLTALISLFIAFLVFQMRATPRTRSLGVLLLFISGWLLTNTIELSSLSETRTVLWAQITYIFINGSMVSWLVFAVHYSNLKRIRWPALALISLIPLTTTILALTNPHHHLIWQSYTFKPGDGFLYMRVQYGPWFWLQIVYVYSVILLAAFFIFRDYFRSFRVFRQRSTTVLVGVILPLITNLVYITKMFPSFQKDYSAVSFALSAIIISWGILRSRSIDLSPVALNTVIDIMSDGMIVIDNKSQVIDINPAALNILDKTRKNVFGYPITDVLSDWGQILSTHESKPAVRSEITLGSAQQPRFFECKISNLYSEQKDQPDGRVIILHEVTERVQLLKKVQELATTDSLTQIANRRYFFEHAEKEFQRALRYRRNLALILFDIDNFKKINDRYGHMVGDKVLADLAKQCQEHTRSIDLLVRFGGEEFVILMPETNLSQAAEAAERLREIIEKHQIVVDSQVISITISLGVTEISQDPGLTLANCLERADKAMYAAKHAGRNQVALWTATKSKQR